MTVSIDIDIDEILWGMSKRDKQQLVEELYDDGFVSQKITEKVGDVDKINKLTGYGEVSFGKKLDELKNKYYSLTKEEEEYFDKVFSRLL